VQARDGATHINVKSESSKSEPPINGRKLSPSHDSTDLPGPPRADLLVPLEEKLPDTWRTLPDEDFLSLFLLMVPLLTSSIFGYPDFQIRCGKIGLMYVKGSASRWSSMRVAMNSVSGSYVQTEEVRLIDARAFRIEPMNGGIMTVDRERLTGPMQVQLLPHVALIMTRKRLS